MPQIIIWSRRPFLIYCHTFCIIQPHSKYFTSLLSPFLRLHLAYSDCFFATTLHLLGTTRASVDFSVQCILTQAICIFGLCVYQDGQNAAWYTEKNWLSTTRRTVLTNDIAETKQRTLHSCALTENHEQVYKFPCSEVDCNLWLYISATYPPPSPYRVNCMLLISSCDRPGRSSGKKPYILQKTSKCILLQDCG